MDVKSESTLQYEIERTLYDSFSESEDLFVKVSSKVISEKILNSIILEINLEIIGFFLGHEFSFLQFPSKVQTCISHNYGNIISNLQSNDTVSCYFQKFYQMISVGTPSNFDDYKDYITNQSIYFHGEMNELMDYDSRKAL